MKNPLLALVLILCLSGCAALSPAQADPQTGAATLPTATLTAPLPTAQASAAQPPEKPAPSATLAPDAPALPPDTPVLAQTSGALTVQVFSGADVEVNTPSYTVTGKAPAGTVLTVNDDIALVDQSQAFAVPVGLDEGPNLIQIVASNTAGDEVDFMLTVTYTKP